eukprot:8788842-Pyramimonas_sp.AAC.1
MTDKSQVMEVDEDPNSVFLKDSKKTVMSKDKAASVIMNKKHTAATSVMKQFAFSVLEQRNGSYYTAPMRRQVPSDTPPQE